MDSFKDMSLEEIIDDLDFNKESQSDCYTTLTLWIPKTHKKMYADIQKHTSRDFSKKLGRLVIEAIDRVHRKAS